MRASLVRSSSGLSDAFEQRSLTDDAEGLIGANNQDTEELSELFDTSTLKRKVYNKKTPGFTTRVKLYLKP